MQQAPAPSQRSIQRRSPQADPGAAASNTDRPFSPTNAQNGAQTRTWSSSGRAGGGAGGSSRSQRATGSTHSSSSSAPALSQIEKSVTHLLVATKQLLETLTLWSRDQADEKQVSDVYVRLGYEFNIACRAFSAVGVDTSDLGNVPEKLRAILEPTLEQVASQKSLDQNLPQIRDIIIKLLHGLKAKQQKLRQKQSRDLARSSSERPGDAAPRNNSTSSISSTNTGVTTLLNEGIDPKHMPENMDIVDGKVVQYSNSTSKIPPRGSSMANSPQRSRTMPKEDSRGSLSSEQSTLSSTTMQNIPVLPPYPMDSAGTNAMPSEAKDLDNHDDFAPPPPPPKQNNALAALQNRGDLERRASRRFSTYQLTKHLGQQAPMPMPPFPAQNARVPNRSLDLREGLTAVRGRVPAAHSKQGSVAGSRLAIDSSPRRTASRISEADEEAGGRASPIPKTPADKLRQSSPDFDNKHSESGLSATLNGPITDIPTYPADGPLSPPKRRNSVLEKQPASPTSIHAPSEARQFVPEQSPQPGKELTLFLQYKSKIKKFVMADGYNELSIARLQLAFIEKFAWNTHNNGVDLPEIYIQDPISGVRHELEDLNDIKDRSVLVLNVEALDEVKRHIDEGLGGIRKMVEGVQSAIDDQKQTIQRVSERQQDTAKEMARINTAPPSARNSYMATDKPARNLSPHIAKNEKKFGNSISTKIDIGELQDLRRDLAVVRQSFTALQANMDNSMSEIRTKALAVTEAAQKAVLPDISGESARSYIDENKKQLVDDADKLVGKVDDLQDIVEDLRKDVVLRGVRPLPRQLEEVAKDLQVATQELRKMQEFLKKERPVWTRIWERELETVCNEREELTMQEDLAADLQDDLEKAMQTFALVEQATKEQMKESNNSLGVGAVHGGLRNISRGLNHVEVDPKHAKTGVLDEVRALQPNHESRLEAIERAEKLRAKEVESRKGGEFQKELGKFVAEDRLKKSGGYEEAERIRKARDERIRREIWEKQSGMTMADSDLPDSPGVPTGVEGPDVGEGGMVDENEVPN